APCCCPTQGDPGQFPGQVPGQDPEWTPVPPIGPWVPTDPGGSYTPAPQKPPQPLPPSTPPMHPPTTEPTPPTTGPKPPTTGPTPPTTGPKPPTDPTPPTKPGDGDEEGSPKWLPFAIAGGVLGTAGLIAACMLIGRKPNPGVIQNSGVEDGLRALQRHVDGGVADVAAGMTNRVGAGTRNALEGLGVKEVFTTNGGITDELIEAATRAKPGMGSIPERLNAVGGGHFDSMELTARMAGLTKTADGYVTNDAAVDAIRAQLHQGVGADEAIGSVVRGSKDARPMPKAQLVEYAKENGFVRGPARSPLGIEIMSTRDDGSRLLVTDIDLRTTGGVAHGIGAVKAANIDHLAPPAVRDGALRMAGVTPSAETATTAGAQDALTGQWVRRLAGLPDASTS
ncbi:MAG: hypothetical protein JWM25_321, partial [Thermoleophilia bacterium]|nr:hypothetical protein [Thermoleophilia bacterium]